MKASERNGKGEIGRRGGRGGSKGEAMKEVASSGYCVSYLCIGDIVESDQSAERRCQTSSNCVVRIELTLMTEHSEGVHNTVHNN